MHAPQLAPSTTDDDVSKRRQTSEESSVVSQCEVIIHTKSQTRGFWDVFYHDSRIVTMATTPSLA